MKEYFKNEDAFGTILFDFCEKIYGDEILDWEMDTLVITLKQDLDCLDINIDKISSIIALENSLKGSLCFFNDVNCFRHTINALNSLEPDYEFLGALIPEHVHWGIYEIAQKYPEYKLDEEPAKFLGLSYHKAGLMLVPEELEEYQEFLNLYNKNIALVPKLRTLWKKYKNSTEDDLDENDFVHVQMLALKADEAYMGMKRVQYSGDLTQS